MNNDNEIKGRFSCKGKIKIKINELKMLYPQEGNYQYNKESICIFFDKFIETLYNKANDNDYVINVPLGVNRDLYISHIDKKILMYIEDNEKNIYTQFLKPKELKKIQFAESQIIKTAIKANNKQLINKIGFLKDNLLRNAIKEKEKSDTNIKIFNKQIDDDFEL